MDDKALIETLHITESDIENLKKMQDLYTAKNLDETLFHMTHEDRCLIRNEMFSLIQNLIDNIRTKPSKSFVLQAFSDMLNEFYLLDTEDKEWICEELTKIMDILKIDNSNGLLNAWLYGFDPNYQD